MSAMGRKLTLVSARLTRGVLLLLMLSDAVAPSRPAEIPRPMKSLGYL